MSLVTIRERLQIIGQALSAKPQPQKDVVEQVAKKVKSVTGGFLDLSNRPLTDVTTVSSKLLDANKGWVYRNNDVIAKEVATIEFELYTVRTVKDEIVLNRIYSHPLLTALDRFNEYTSSYDGFYTTQSHKKLAGDAFWYVDRTGPIINSISILPPDKVTIDLGKVGGSRRIIQSYTYEDTIKGEPVKVVYDPDEIVHFKTPNPNNFYRGLSAVVAAADAIDTDNMAAEASKKLFQRGLIAELMLTTDKSLTPEQIKQLHTEFRNSYQGVQNAYTVPIFSGGIKPETVQVTNRDAQFIEQQQWLRDKICSIFGNPKSIITTDDVNRSNADATILNWKRTTITSEMKNITDTLNEFLVPLYGDNLLLGFCDPVEEDESSKITDVKTLREADIITVNEAREELGMEAIDGGDELNATRAERQFANIALPKSLQKVKTSRVLNKHYERVEQYKRMKEMVRPYAEKLVKGKKNTKAIKRYSVDSANQYYQKQIQIVEMAEKVFRDKVQSFIDRLVDKALDNVPNEIQDMQNKALINEADMVVEATIDFTPILMEVATQSGTEALNLINSAKPYVALNIRKAIEKRVKAFAKSMVDTDQDKLIDLIKNGIEQGLSVPDITSGIRDTFNDFSKMQTDRIVRTEVLRTSNLAAVDAWEQSGEVVGKQWLTSPGADAECAVYEGKIVSLKGNFYSTSEFADGDPPIHPNCRCTILPILKGEMASNADIKVKQLESEMEELINRTVDVDKFQQTAKQLESERKEHKKSKATISKLKEQIAELEGFIDES